MRQFIAASDDALTALKAIGRCVQFHDQELPAGSNPPVARVGLEVNSADESTALFVDRGIQYTGQSPTIQQWLGRGEIRFPSFNEWKSWVRKTLAQEYSCERSGNPAPLVSNWVIDWPTGPTFPVVGRDDLMEEAQAVLAQETIPTAVTVVGRSGVGKTAFVREVARRWKEQGAGRVSFRVDLAAMLAGTILPADRMERLKHAFNQVLRAGSSALVVIEDIHEACGSLSTGAVCIDGDRSRRIAAADAVACLVLRSALDSGLRLCATTTPRGLAMFRNCAIRRRLHIISIAEPEPSELVGLILPQVSQEIAERHGLEISREALAIAARRSETLPGGQPGKAIRLLDHAAALARGRGLRVLGPDDVPRQ